MVAYKELKTIDGVKGVVLPYEININKLANMWQDEAEKRGIFIDVCEDQVFAGGLLSKKTYPCLVITHPDHKADYRRFCCVIASDGRRNIVELYTWWFSRLESKLKFSGKVSRLLHGDQYEMEYVAESAFYSSIHDIWGALFE
ncbi:MAG: hypothetical protein PUD16_13700 [bacterium]|nr:hypothetical protein [bacterium]